MKKVVVDTNIFLRTLIKEDADTFRNCTAFLRLIKEGRIKAYTCTLVLTEIGWTLKSYYRFSKKEVLLGLKSILGLKGLRITDEYEVGSALELFEKTRVKLIDSFIASLKVVKEGAEIVSYDRDFDKLGVKRKEPGDYV